MVLFKDCAKFTITKFDIFYIKQIVKMVKQNLSLVQNNIDICNNSNDQKH